MFTSDRRALTASLSTGMIGWVCEVTHSGDHCLPGWDSQGAGWRGLRWYTGKEGTVVCGLILQRSRSVQEEGSSGASKMLSKEGLGSQGELVSRRRKA